MRCCTQCRRLSAPQRACCFPLPRAASAAITHGIAATRLRASHHSHTVHSSKLCILPTTPPHSQGNGVVPEEAEHQHAELLPCLSSPTAVPAAGVTRFPLAGRATATRT